MQNNIVMSNTRKVIDLTFSSNHGKRTIHVRFYSKIAKCRPTFAVFLYVFVRLFAANV